MKFIWRNMGDHIVTEVALLMEKKEHQSLHKSFILLL